MVSSLTQLPEEQQTSGVLYVLSLNIFQEMSNLMEISLHQTHGVHSSPNSAEIFSVPQQKSTIKPMKKIHMQSSHRTWSQTRVFELSSSTPSWQLLTPFLSSVCCRPVGPLPAQMYDCSETSVLTQRTAIHNEST